MWQEHTDSGGQLPLQPGTAYCSVYGECPLSIVSSAFGGVVMFRDEVGRHIYILYNVANFTEPRSAGRNIDAIIIATSLRTQPPVAAGGSGGWKAKWAEVQRRRKEDERPSCHASANFLLVFVAHSIMLLHTPVPVIQGRPRPAKCIITLNRYCRCTYVGHHTR